MSFIDNIHTNVQSLINKGPLGGRGPHNTGGPPQHSQAHQGAGDRNFGGPKGGDSPAGVPRAVPPGPGGLPTPPGVGRPQPGQVPAGIDRPGHGVFNPGGPSGPGGPGPGGPGHFNPGVPGAPGHVNTGGAAHTVQSTLGTVQDLVNAVVPRPGPHGLQSPGPPGHAHHGAQAGGPPSIVLAPPPFAGMHAGVAQILAHSPATPAASLANQHPGGTPPGQAGVVPRGDMTQQALPAPHRSEVAHQAVALPQRGGESVPTGHSVPVARGDLALANPLRPDALPPAPRSEAALTERMAALQRAPAAPMALPANAAATTAAAATAAGATLATAAAAATVPALPAAQAADARNVPVLTVADRGHGVRAEVMTGTYTGEGPQRRGLRRGARALPGSLSALLGAIGAQGRTSGEGRDARAAERELQAAAMQWLFWLLALIAYGCVAFAVVGLMPAGGGTGTASIAGRSWAGGFAIAGLVAAVGAWWFARRMARGGGTPPRAPRNGD